MCSLLYYGTFMITEKLTEILLAELLAERPLSSANYCHRPAAGPRHWTNYEPDSAKVAAADLDIVINDYVSITNEGQRVEGLRAKEGQGN